MILFSNNDGRWQIEIARIALALFRGERKTTRQNKREGKIVLQLNANSGLESKFVNQITRLNLQRLGNAQQCVQTNPLLSAFNFPHIYGVQIGFFRKLFLAQTSLFTSLADGVAQDFKLSRTRHGLLAKQDRPNVRTPNMGLFCLADTMATA